MKKIIRAYVTIICLNICMQSIVYAGDSYSLIADRIGPILNAIAWVGYVIALGMMLYIGIKYTMAAANEKANLKQGVINYLIGAFLIIGASAIANIISSIATRGSGKDASGMAGQIISAATNLTRTN